MNQLVSRLLLNKRYHLCKFPPSQGFTLAELLIAASITFFVISFSMVGLMEVLKINQQSESETVRRQDLNRAIEFMADEIRSATLINPDAQDGVKAAEPDFVLPNGATPVLVLAVPGVSEVVIYYLEASRSPWLGPNLIRRWGPGLDKDGNYVNPTQPSQWDTDSADGLGDVLVDAIDDQFPNPNPSCPKDWLVVPAYAGRQGFFSCISQEGRSVSLYLQAQIKGTYGSQAKTYRVSSDVSTRSR